MAHEFIYLNTDPDGASCNIKCERVPCIKPSRSGLTCVSFSGILPRFTDIQIVKFKGRRLGVIAPDVAEELREFCKTARALTRPQRLSVEQCLVDIISGSHPKSPRP